MHELKPKLDTRKSFYGKAKVEQTEFGTVLYSYGTKVCESFEDKLIVYPESCYSATTLRHVKDYLYQYHGMNGLTKRDIELLSEY